MARRLHYGVHYDIAETAGDGKEVQNDKVCVMFDSMFQSTAIPVLQEVVGFSQARHTILAGNIANMDTPGYKVRDLSVEDFREQLQEAIEQQAKPPVPRSPGDLLPEPHTPLLGEVAKNAKAILYHDKSNVGLEYQVTEMVKNQMQHNLALSVMSSQFQLLRAAVSGRT